MFLGLGVGFGLALLLEYAKSCFRSINDISRVMVVPVLGTVNHISTRGEKARALAGRLLVGGAALAFVSILGFITWAWKSNQQMLSPQVVDAIERFPRSSSKSVLAWDADSTPYR